MKKLLIVIYIIHKNKNVSVFITTVTKQVFSYKLILDNGVLFKRTMKDNNFQAPLSLAYLTLIYRQGVSYLLVLLFMKGTETLLP